MPHELCHFVSTVRENNCPANSIRSIQDSSLAKLFALRLGTNDAFVLDFFGYIAVQDFFNTRREFRP